MTGRRARRAQGAVLCGIAFVVLFNLALNISIDTAKPEWRDPEYGHRLKELQPLTQSADGKPLVVALGSSRSQMGFNPLVTGLDETAVVYNFSQAGCGPLHELLNLHRLLAAGIKPDYLLVEILPPVLGGEAKAEKLLMAERLSAEDFRQAKPYCHDASELHDRWMKTRVSPWYAYRLNLVSHHWGSLLPWQSRQYFMWKQMKPRGWLPYFFEEITAEKRQDGVSKAHFQYSPYFIDFHIAPLPERAYSDLIELCKQHDILLAFYTMPESPTFRSWYTPKARQTIDEYFRNLSTGFPVFDCSAWFNEETTFADSHHLMRKGAGDFSTRFGKECIGPWVASNPPLR